MNSKYPGARVRRRPQALAGRALSRLRKTRPADRSLYSVETYAAKARREHLECLRLFAMSRGCDPAAETMEKTESRRPFRAEFDTAERVEIAKGYRVAKPLYDAYHARVRALIAWCDEVEWKGGLARAAVRYAEL